MKEILATSVVAEKTSGRPRFDHEIESGLKHTTRSSHKGVVPHPSSNSDVFFFLPGPQLGTIQPVTGTYFFSYTFLIGMSSVCLPANQHVQLQQILLAPDINTKSDILESPRVSNIPHV